MNKVLNKRSLAVGVGVAAAATALAARRRRHAQPVMPRDESVGRPFLMAVPDLQPESGADGHAPAETDSSDPGVTPGGDPSPDRERGMTAGGGRS